MTCVGVCMAKKSKEHKALFPAENSVKPCVLFGI